MKRVHVSRCKVMDQNWVVYKSDDGLDKYVDLSSCANSFALTVGKDRLHSKDCIGWRYKEDDTILYELFNIGHLLIYASTKATLYDRIQNCLSKRVRETRNAKLLREFEEALNRVGWRIADKTACCPKDEI